MYTMSHIYQTDKEWDDTNLIFYNWPETIVVDEDIDTVISFLEDCLKSSSTLWLCSS